MGLRLLNLHRKKLSSHHLLIKRFIGRWFLFALKGLEKVSSQLMFAQKGFMNTTIDDLTKSAGVSHGNFFVHYSKREDLIINAIEKIGKSIYERFLALADEDMELEYILNAHLDAIKEYEPLYYFMVAEGVFLPEQARTAFFVLQNGIRHWMKKTSSHK